MTRAEAAGEVFWTAFKGLGQREQRAVIGRLLQDESLRRDLVDLAVIAERRGETGRPLRDYLKGQQKKS